MARKSRKAQPQNDVESMGLSIRAALYIRLSVEDAKTGSISIETQRMILDRFLESKPEIFVYDTYIDNGATGTNFHRPSFQQMLSDIEAGLVNCVIVKDLSRLGRNSIDTGYYIEQYFPAHKVRFIAVTDQFDSDDPNDVHAGIILPLKNMINEAYAIDIGRKIKAQQQQAMKDGEYVGGRTPYGYLKAPDNCHKLVVDPQTAPVVRQVFQWASEGVGINAIVCRLNEGGIAAPSHYKKSIGQITHDNLIGNGKWQTRTVTKVLRCETYTGDLVQGHTKIVDHRQVKANADNLIVVQNTHEAIISHELFDKVQKRLDTTAEKYRNKSVSPYTPNPLKGKVFCAHCGKSLHRQKEIRKKTDDIYIFHCLSNSRVAKESCLGVTIREDALMPVLLDMLKREMLATLGDYALMLPCETEEEKQRLAMTETISERRQDTVKYRSLIRGLYESLVQGVVTNEEYFSFKEQYEANAIAAEQEASELEHDLKALDGQRKHQRALSQDLDSIHSDSALVSILIERLVDRVEITHDRDIHVKFRFQSEFEADKEVREKCSDI